MQTTDAAGNPQVLEQDVINGATADVTGMTADAADVAFAAAESQAVTPAQPARPSSYQASYNTTTVFPASKSRSARYQSKRTDLIVFCVGNHCGVVNFYQGLNIRWHSVDVTMRYGSPTGDAVSLFWKERLRHEKGFGGDSTLVEFGTFGSSPQVRPDRVAVKAMLTGQLVGGVAGPVAVDQLSQQRRRDPPLRRPLSRGGVRVLAIRGRHLEEGVSRRVAGLLGSNPPERRAQV